MFSAEIMGDLVKNSKEKQKNASVKTEAFQAVKKLFFDSLAEVKGAPKTSKPNA